MINYEPKKLNKDSTSVEVNAFLKRVFLLITSSQPNIICVSSEFEGPCDHDAAAKKIIIDA